MADHPDSHPVDESRNEDKYIVPKENYVEVKHMVESHLPPYFPEPGIMYSINRSIYFDSPDLTFLKQHLNKLENRRKIRIRTYAPNGKWNQQYFLEIKSKINGRSLKTRLKLSQKAFEHVMATSQVMINEELIQENSDTARETVLQEAKLMNYLMLTNSVKPVIDITYKRYAYEADAPLRVTIDQDIKVKPLTLFKTSTIQDLQNQDLWETLTEYGERYSNIEDFLLEVKHQKDEVPQWIEEMLDKYDLEAKPFSKYVWGMFQVMSKTLKLLKG